MWLILSQRQGKRGKREICDNYAENAGKLEKLATVRKCAKNIANMIPRRMGCRQYGEFKDRTKNPIQNQQPSMWHPPHLKNSIQTQQKSSLLESYIATFRGNLTTPLNSIMAPCPMSRGGGFFPSFFFAKLKQIIQSYKQRFFGGK